MELTLDFKNMGLSLADVSEEDLKDFISIERVSHHQYVEEYRDFFGEWNEEILRDSFREKKRMTFFKKLLWKNETVGFLSYNRQGDRIDKIFIRLIKKAQNMGIGTWFLTELKVLSREFRIPLFLAVIKTNPARNLYRHLGFELYKEQDAFYFFRYTV